VKIIIHLSPEEVRTAAVAAVDVRIRAVSNGIQAPAKQRYLKHRPWWHYDIVGYIAEVAACKALGYEWTPEPEYFKAPDCGPYQIRSIEDKATGLLVRERDDDDSTFILAQVRDFRVCLHGWMTGRAVRALGQDAYEDAKRVEIYQLNPMEELNEWDTIDWSDDVEPYDPDQKVRQFRESMTG